MKARTPTIMGRDQVLNGNLADFQCMTYSQLNPNYYNVSYTWFRNDKELAHATLKKYEIPEITIENDKDVYRCTVNVDGITSDKSHIFILTGDISYGFSCYFSELKIDNHGRAFIFL